MATQRVGSAGSQQRVGSAGFRTAAAAREGVGGNAVDRGLAEPMRKLQTTPDLKIGSRPTSSEVVATAHTFDHFPPPPRDSPPRESSPPRGKPKSTSPTIEETAPRTTPSKDASRTPSKEDSKTLPILVDARIKRGAGPTLAEMAAVPPLAAPVGMGESGPFSPSGPDSDTALVFAQKPTGGGATCTAPRHAGHNTAARKNAVREPMGEVMLLGAGMRPLRSGGALPPVTAAPGLEGVPPQTVSNEEVQRLRLSAKSQRGDSPKAAGGDSPKADTSQDVQLSAPTDAATLPKLKTAPPSSVFTCSVLADLHSAPQTEAPEAPMISQAKGESIDAVAKPSSSNKELALADRSNDADALMTSMQEVPILAEVRKQDACLQTDAQAAGHNQGWADVDNLRGKGSASNYQQRILIVQRCNPKQIDFGSWTPIPKDEVNLTPERRYLSHVRTRFPGTVDDGCRLTKGNSRRILAPHIEALSMRVVAEGTTTSDTTADAMALEG